MDSKNIEAYNYYKQQYPGTVIFFRVGNNYEAYQEDAKIVSPIIGEEPGSNMNKISFPTDKVYDFIALLANHNITTKLISYRNENGDFDVPDIEKIKYDQEIDY